MINTLLLQSVSLKMKWEKKPSGKRNQGNKWLEYFAEHKSHREVPSALFKRNETLPKTTAWLIHHTGRSSKTNRQGLFTLPLRVLPEACSQSKTWCLFHAVLGTQEVLRPIILSRKQLKTLSSHRTSPVNKVKDKTRCSDFKRYFKKLKPSKFLWKQNTSHVVGFYF